MRIDIPKVNSLIEKKVPAHGKISGLTFGKRVKIIVPGDDTSISMVVMDAAEIVERNVTNEGKVLGLTKYVGKTVYVLDAEGEK
jgi:hypothetical protein